MSFVKDGNKDNEIIGSKNLFKRSPSGINREKFYTKSNENNNIKLEKIDETVFSNISDREVSENEVVPKINIKLENNPPVLNHKAIKEKYKRERQKSSIFKSEDLRISKTEIVNIANITNNQSNYSNSNFIFQSNCENTKSSIVKEQSYIENRNSYININNINICSAISINSIKKENDICGINTFDILRTAKLDNLSPTPDNTKAKQTINLNLTISKNDFNDKIQIAKKLFANQTENTYEAYKLEVDNPIRINIIQEK
jgi:hypothetical protein